MKFRTLPIVAGFLPEIILFEENVIFLLEFPILEVLLLLDLENEELEEYDWLFESSIFSIVSSIWSS